MCRLLPVARRLLAGRRGRAPAASRSRPRPKITWKKTVLDTQFRSEGVAVADVNKDGKIDVLNGEYWYEAPDWKLHEMQPLEGLRGRPEQTTAASFACWADDFNGDGCPDLIVIDFPGDAVLLDREPEGQGRATGRSTTIWHTRLQRDAALRRPARQRQARAASWASSRRAEANGNEGQMAYFTPDEGPDAAVGDAPDQRAERARASRSPARSRFSHGLGVGDLNGDGRLDVICTGGWWEQPAKADGKTPWKFHPANLGDACADMFAYDMDGDGKADVLSTSAHQFGIWWHKQRPEQGRARRRSSRRTCSAKLVSRDARRALRGHRRRRPEGPRHRQAVVVPRPQRAGVRLAGRDLLVQGRRRTPDGITSFTPMLIDDDSGIGTQFEVADINGDGLLDVVASNKKGVRVIVQERK